MSQFNLLHEPWIAVMTDNKGSTKEVSMVELFRNAHQFKRLAGDTPAQDFAILRLLLAVLHTVFSRLDTEGNPYVGITLDQRFVPCEEMDEDDEEDYKDAMVQNWVKLMSEETCPKIIESYLKKWEDHFDLFDKDYPFYQVTKENLEKINVKKTGFIQNRLINRLISQSNNKIELMTPYGESNKNNLSTSSLARWLIAFQGYTGTGDKAKYPGMTASASKGWLMGLGGIYLSGDTLKETLLLNMTMLEEAKKQTPVWEKEFDQVVKDGLRQSPDNLADLYTNYSRLLYIHQGEKEGDGIMAVQLPGIDSQEFFLEPMTLWTYPKTGNDKDHFIPKTHQVNQGFWRSFGLVSQGVTSLKTRDGERIENVRPGIIRWHNEMVANRYIQNKFAKLVAVGISYNRDASTMPNDEIYDELNIYHEVLADVGESGWVYRIIDEVELTKRVVDEVLRGFANNISKIRNLTTDGLTTTVVQKAYYEIDHPFREWLAQITLEDDKEEKVLQWRKNLRAIVQEQGRELLVNAGKRDFLGTVITNAKSEGKYLNVEIAYNIFMSRLKNLLNN